MISRDYHMTSAGILISSGSQPMIRRNRVFSSQAAGIEITNGGGGDIHDNEIFDNRFEGICLATGVKPTVSGKPSVCVCVCALHFVMCVSV